MGLVAREFAGTIGLDPRWVDDADLHAVGVQEAGWVQALVASRLQAGAQWPGRIGMVPDQPGEELLEASFGVGEGGRTNPLSGRESGVEPGVGDVDANDTP